MVDSLKQTVEKVFSVADIRINGDRPWDLQVKDDRFYARLIKDGSLGLGETYMEGWWDSVAMDDLLCRLIKTNLDNKVKYSKTMIYNYIKARVLNQQRKSKAYEIAEKHYNIGNNLYKNMLDKRMCYSCGYWKDAKTLDKAQEEKLDLICKKIKLKKGMTVLDIGCGWGGFAKFAAEKYGAKVVGITVSKEQAKIASEICKGLDVDIRVEDYRNINERFDRIVSVGMFEHVGHKNYHTFMRIVHKSLKDDGLFLLHTIGANKPIHHLEPWFHRYIFPNGILPSASQITKAYEGYFKLEDWHNFGTHYDKTLMVWHKNFNKNWDKVKGDYDERFFRMWNYYLLASAASFRAEKNQLWQIVLSKAGSIVRYESVR